MLKARRSERRASMVSRGHECVLDGQIEQAVSDRHYRKCVREYREDGDAISDFFTKTVTCAASPKKQQ